MKIITKKEAASLIKDDSIVGIGGFAAYCSPDELLDGLKEYYKETRHPRNITVISGVCTGDNGFRDIGHNKLCEEGLLKRIIAAHFRQAGMLAKWVAEEKLAAYTLPLGQIMEMLRAAGSGNPGHLSKIGLHTYVDPNVEGCMVNESAKKDSLKPLIQHIQLDDSEILYYRALPLDVCLIRATYSDMDGNISNKHEGIQESIYQYALAAHNNGGIVIVQVEEILQNGSISPQDVHISGIMVDYVVKSSPKNHMQSFAHSVYHPELTGEYKIPTAAITPMPLTYRKIIARRAVMELRPNMVINIGIGIPSGVGNVANEEGLLQDIVLSIESGSIGGIPVEGFSFGGAYNSKAIFNVDNTFEFYDGGGLDVTFLGLAEVDQYGNVNVSKFGKVIAGPGGFIDITQNSKVVCFIGTFTAIGNEYSIEDGMIKIVREGTSKKFVNHVQQITFSAEYAYHTNQTVYYITERGVFKLVKEGLMLIEIADGIDLQKDILNQMDFTPVISRNLRIMDKRIFMEEKMNLKRV